MAAKKKNSRKAGAAKKAATKKGATKKKAVAGPKKSTASKKSSPRKKKGTRKYSPEASADVENAMRERKQGKLRSGRSAKKVTSRKQAIAIGLSEARKRGAKVPRKKATKKQ